MTQSGSDLSPRPQTIEGRTARQVLVVVAIAFVLWLCVQLRVILVDIIVAITLASAIAPIAIRAEKWKIPRGVTVLIVYLLVAAIYTLLGRVLWVTIREQINLFAAQVPKMQANLINSYNGFVSQFNISSDFHLEQKHFETVGQAVLNRTLDVSAGALGIILNVVLILFLTAYFVANSKLIWDSILQWVPVKYRARVASLVQPVGFRMGGYVRGQLLVSTAVGAFFAIGLTMIGVKSAVVLGILAGVMNLVPFVGSMITTVLAVAIAFGQEGGGLLMAGLTLVLFVVEQTIESNFIVPYLLGSQVELDPLVVLMAVLIGATLGGGVGALVAVPITAALLLIGNELYLKPMHEQEAILP